MSATPLYNSISAFMQSILDAIVAVYTAEGVPLPSRQLLATGQVPHDCEQVSVAFIQLYLGTPGSQAEQPQACNAPRTGVFEISVVRQTATPEPRTSSPTAANITLVTEQQMRDAWLLMDAARTAIEDFAGILADIAPSENTGGFQGVVMNLVAAIP